MYNPHHADPIDVIARTVWGEARGEGQNGQIAVIWVIRNRAGGNNQNTLARMRTECLRPQQFSCWNAGNVNQQLLMGNAITQDPEYIAIRNIVQDVMNEMIPDTTVGSRHYHVTGTETDHPWANGQIPVVIIGHHSFYNNIH